MLKLPKSKLHSKALTSRILRELVIWVFIIPASFAITWFWLAPNKPANAATAPLSSAGAMFYGDTTNAGIMRARLFTPPNTWAAEINGITGSASNILFVTADTAPTREEIMIGSLRANGTLQVETCTTACDANGDYTSRWSHASNAATLDCDLAPTVSSCVQPFDIAYEQLGGRAMVVYAGDGTDGGTTTDAGTLFYALWDGSAWSPNTTPGTPDSTNTVSTSFSAGTPTWVRLVPEGDLLDKDRSNRMMLMAGTDDFGGTLALYTAFWDGTSWSTPIVHLSTALEGCTEARCFDGAWTRNNLGQSVFVMVFGFTESTPVNDLEYRTFTVGPTFGGGTWGTVAQAYTTASATGWVQATSDPTSSRLLFTNADDGSTGASAVWRGDDSTDGFTKCATGGCPEASIEDTGGQQMTAAFERFSGQGIVSYNDAGTTAGDSYMTFAASSTWGATTVTGMAPADDPITMRSWTNPNNDDIMMALVDIDCDLDTQQWNGTALDTAANDIELSSSVINGAGACSNNGAPVDATAGNGFDFAYKVHAAWQRNWRFFDGTDTASLPTTALAAENTTPTAFARAAGIFRLRINYAERGRSVSSTDARKKLQYATNCNPNNTNAEVGCTWVDVDDAGGSGIWRYKDLACTPTDCAEANLLTATTLTGSAACSLGLGCSTWVLDKDAAATGNMDFTAQSGADTVQEGEWIVEANGAQPGKTYYFRIYNVDLDTPIYREQDSADCGAGSATCTYPSLVTDGAPATSDFMRHGNWFSGGAEQSFFYWVD